MDKERKIPTGLVGEFGFPVNPDPWQYEPKYKTSIWGPMIIGVITWGLYFALEAIKKR